MRPSAATCSPENPHGPERRKTVFCPQINQLSVWVLCVFCAVMGCGEATPPPSAIGTSQRQHVETAERLVQDGRLGEAANLLDGVLADIRNMLTSPTTRYVCAATEEEYRSVVDSLRSDGDGEQTVDAARVDSCFETALHMRAFVAAKSQEWPKASELLAEAAECAPKSAAIQMDLGFIHRKLGKPAEAIEFYRSAIALSKGGKDSKDLLVHALAVEGVELSLIQRDRPAGPGAALLTELIALEGIGRPGGDELYLELLDRIATIRKPYQSVGRAAEPRLIIQIRKDGSFWVDGRRYSQADLLKYLRDVDTDLPEIVELQASSEISYAQMAGVMKALAEAGIKRISMTAPKR